MEIDETNVKVGSRFVCDGFYGTVRYVGAVALTEGVWYGVEWDDPSRGKHDGFYNEQRYFSTRNPCAGSFLRLNKMDLGVGFLEAVYQRYKHKNTISDLKEEKELHVVMKNNSILPIEAVGYQKIGAKQSRLDRLLDVSVSRMKVSHSGLLSAISETVPNIRELDLSVSLLSSWEDVANIAAQLKHLETLNLSENTLEIPSDPSVMASSFSALKVIALSKLGYSWQQILSCSTMWPNIREMLVPFNEIRDIEIPKDRLNDLEYLDLESNPLVDWSQVKALGCLPKLKSLNLNCTGLSRIIFDDVRPEMKTKSFPALECIMLQNNKIAEWSDINELNKLMRLKEIAFMNNPLSNQESPATFRQLLIAKIGNLATLNRTGVKADERRGAELDYLKRQGIEWLRLTSKVPSDKVAMDAFSAEHPRYFELIERHGAPEESETKKQSNTLIGNLLSVEIVCASKLDQKPIIKKFPGSLSINKLRCVIQRLLRIDMQGLTMWCVSKKNLDIKVAMDNDLRMLDFYAEEGDRILVE